MASDPVAGVPVGSGDDQHYASLLRGLDGIVWEADASTFRFSYVSDASVEILGFPPAAWTESATFWQEHIHPDDRERAIRFCVDSTARGESHQFEYRMIAADGRVVWLRDVVSVLVQDDGPTLLRGVMIDITARKAEEERVEQDRTSLKLSLDLAQLGRWEIDTATRIVTMDDEIYRMLRTTAAEQGGYTMPLATYRERFLPRELHDRSTAMFAEVLKTADPHFTRQIEQRWIRADGTDGFVSMRFTTVCNAAGQLVGGRGVVQDITERKKTELRLTRLLEGESLLSSFSQRFIQMDLAQFDAGVTDALRAFGQFGSMARVALFVYASDGSRILNSHEWCADQAGSLIEELREMPVGTYGYFRQELTALRVVRIEKLSDLPEGSSEMHWARERGACSCLLYPLTSRSQLIGVLGFYGPIGVERAFDSDLQSLLASFAASVANLVSRKVADEQRLLLERQLLQAQKMEAIGTLAGGIAHDFNNILSAIVGNLGLARIEQEHGRPMEHSLQEIEAAAERARGLIQQILAFSRQQEHERRVIALGPIVEEATRMMRATIPAIVSIDASIEAAVPDVVADPTQMHQILMNLCANAWHAMDDHPGHIAIRVDEATLRAEAAARIGIQPGRYVCLAVRDNGKGMDDETKNRIFDPFFTTKTVGKGTGLGLSVVHGIVRGHDGGILVASEVGRGTTVQVFIPASMDTALEAQAQPAPTRGRGERIMLVDDEEAIVKVMSRILERLGYQVTAFLNPLQALQTFKQSPYAFDLVISDYEMPEATGLVLAKAIHDARPEMPVVLCSGRYRADAGVAAEGTGNVRRLITKPCSASVVSHVVREVLDEHVSA